MAVKIIVDSACDISVKEAERLDIIRLPLTVRFSQDEYEDGVTLTHEEFYQRLLQCDDLPTTSQIAPAVFAKVFQEVCDQGDSAVVITVSAKLSGTYQSAMLAASEVKNIYVVDSANVCIGQRLLVERAAALRQEGFSAERIAKALDEEKGHIVVLALLDTLLYLKKGGRISSATAFAGELLSIKPLVAVIDGEVKLIGKARGVKKGNRLLRERMEESGGIRFEMPFSLAYSGLSRKRLDAYIEESQDIWQEWEGEDLPITTVGCVIGTHVGPNGIAVAFFQKGASKL